MKYLALIAALFAFTACPDMTPEQARAQAEMAAAYANAAQTVIHGAVQDYKDVQSVVPPKKSRKLKPES